MKSSSVDYHGSLGPFEEACRLARADIRLTKDLLRAPQLQGVPLDGMPNILLRKAALALRHLRFVFRVWGLREHQYMLVREFSNAPLALVFPCFRFARERLLFTVNHNLQWTRHRFTERAAFRLLGRMGCQFVFFEHIPEDALRELGLDAGRSLALPVPVRETRCRRTRSGGIRKIGVIGQFRVEKGVADLMKQLRLLSADYAILIGAPNADEFRQTSPYGRDDWFELRPTSAFDAYQKALSECDAIVLNNLPSGYQFRASGVIADAAAAHVPAVVRRLPVLESQVSRPVRIGECFDDLSALGEILRRVDENLRNGAYRFEEYGQARTARVVAEILDGFIARSRP